MELHDLGDQQKVKFFLLYYHFSIALIFLKKAQPFLNLMHLMS